ncbi:hypothetical protein MNV49_005560 [Pseudohyphozyma bogoriensis]|nr:hypothetical protein MNV49_005560 [Pseudohyphozyma bogoriensis]
MLSVHISYPRPDGGLTPYRSGETLTGVVVHELEDEGQEVTLEGYVQLNLKQHHHTPTITKFAIFSTTTIKLDEKDKKFSLDLPATSTKLTFEGEAEEFAPPPTFRIEKGPTEVVWGVRVKGGKKEEKGTFNFVPDKIESVEINLPTPHTYSRLLSALDFTLSLEHEPSKKLLVERQKDIKIYAAQVALWRRVEVGVTEEGEEVKRREEEIRHQLIPLTMTLSKESQDLAASFNMTFDLQSPGLSGGSTPLSHLPPSLTLPGLSLKYFLKFEILPAHNQRYEVGSVEIVVQAGEEEERKSGVQGMREGRPVMA